MKLSEQLLQSHNSGDCGNYFEGYAERATLLEAKLKLAVDALSCLQNAVITQNTLGAKWDSEAYVKMMKGLSLAEKALATIKEMDK